jgi:hypothetical protein
LKFQVVPPSELVSRRVPLALITTFGGIGAQVQRLHAALGHPNLKRMKGIVKQSFTSPVSNKLRQEILGLTSFYCDCCHKGRTTSETAPTHREPAQYLPGEYLFSDIAGPFLVQCGGFKYFIVWVDFCSKIFFIFFSTPPNHTLVVRSFLIIDNELFNRTGGHVRFVNCDNGAGYQAKFKQVCEKLGTTIRRCVPYQHAQNRGAERAIRTLKEQGVTNHTQSNLNDVSTMYLFDAIHVLHFAYTRQAAPQANGVSIFEDYYDRPPHPRRLLSFGCLASATIPHELKLSHGKRAENGIVLGYDTSTPNGYLILRENDIGL